MELAISAKGEVKQKPLRDGAKVVGEAWQSRRLRRDVRPKEEVGDSCCSGRASSGQDEEFLSRPLPGLLLQQFLPM